jgi:DDE family transposase
VLGRSRNLVLERQAADAIAQADGRSRRTGQPRRILASFAHAAATWDRPRRVVVKAEHNAPGPDPRFLVVDGPGDPRGLYEDVYCQRRDLEDRIQEPRSDLFAGRTSRHRSPANQFRLLLGAAADVRVQAPRRTARAGTARARAQVGTIRLRPLEVAARVVVGARRVVSHLSSSSPPQERSRAALERLTARATPGRAGVG